MTLMPATACARVLAILIVIRPSQSSTRSSSAKTLASIIRPNASASKTNDSGPAASGAAIGASPGAF